MLTSQGVSITVPTNEGDAHMIRMDHRGFTATFTMTDDGEWYYSAHSDEHHADIIGQPRATLDAAMLAAKADINDFYDVEWSDDEIISL